MSSALTQTLCLCLAIVLSFTWTSIPAANHYNLQAVAIIDLIYFISRILLPRFYRSTSNLPNIISAMVFVSITLILIISTGSLTSPLFFLLQFLLFFLALLFHPVSVATTATATIISLILTHPSTQNTASIINLISIALITPVAILFGQKFTIASKAQKQISDLNQEITTEETATLIWLSTVAKSQLTISLDLIAQVIGSNKLPWHLQEKLKNSYRDLLALYRSADSLKSEISNPKSEI